MVLFVNAYGMVHVIFGNQSIFFGGLVKLEYVIGTDFCFIENIRDTVCKDRVRIGMTIAVFGLVGVGEVDHRKHVGRVAERFGNFEMVTAVMPSARQVVANL